MPLKGQDTTGASYMNILGRGNDGKDASFRGDQMK